MSEEQSIPEQRTEMPTGRRMGELRRKGILPLSNEVVQVVSMLTGYYMFQLVWNGLFGKLKLSFVKSFELIARREPFEQRELYHGFIGLLIMFGPYIGAIVFVVAGAATLATMLQTDWNVKEHKFEFKWNLINPMAGLQRIFSISGIITTVKALLKLSLVLPMGYLMLKSFAPQMIGLIHLSIEQVFAFTSTGLGKLFWNIVYILIPFAIFDWAWGKYQWLRNYKMTKQEVKDEKKSIEGDEETRRRIMWKGLQRIADRLRMAVPKAHVIVTNPTHYAVALQYDRDTMAAPTVVAKGRDFIAEQIKAIAREHGIPVLERKPLARALYASAEVGSTIPRELYRAVAEVLAYVYKLKNPHWSPQSAKA